MLVVFEIHVNETSPLKECEARAPQRSLRSAEASRPHRQSEQVHVHPSSMWLNVCKETEERSDEGRGAQERAYAGSGQDPRPHKDCACRVVRNIERALWISSAR